MKLFPIRGDLCDGGLFYLLGGVCGMRISSDASVGNSESVGGPECGGLEGFLWTGMGTVLLFFSHYRLIYSTSFLCGTYIHFFLDLHSTHVAATSGQFRLLCGCGCVPVVGHYHAENAAKVHLPHRNTVNFKFFATFSQKFSFQISHFSFSKIEFDFTSDFFLLFCILLKFSLKNFRGIFKLEIQSNFESSLDFFNLFKFFQILSCGILRLLRNMALNGAIVLETAFAILCAYTPALNTALTLHDIK